ncbi:STE3-like pheromone receptor B mating type [Gelatoporia subvermispora B]|uniref:STE3-like pheromone receptor B mating type n=1 Tax=Ceriporiopsis subvermispora (strain B) TaxID=914234 RepID=M2QT64_CERS8|nr:STE3-like pheromone receptor B mating type [Gelatoporia subvermispora B]
MHPEFPYVALFAAACLLVPLPWHWRARNIATLSIIAWLFVIDVIYAVDAIVWKHSVDIVIPVWCDITTKIIIGSNIALPAASMCVSIHLEQVSSIRQVSFTKASKRRRQIIELVLCWLVPAIWMALHYCVQGHRFDILEDYGCRPTTYVSIPAIFLIWVPPLMMAVVAMVCSGLAFYHFLRQRISFARHLQSTNSGLNTSRYLRLMAMSIVEMLLGIAATSATLAFSVIWDMRPWTNWANVHWDFSRIDLYATFGTPPFILTYYYVLWWIPPASSFIFFFFFAFGQEAMKEYQACFSWVLLHVFKIQPGAPAKPSFAKFSFNLRSQSHRPTASACSSTSPGAGASAATAPAMNQLEKNESYLLASSAESDHSILDLSYDKEEGEKGVNTPTDDVPPAYPQSAPPSPLEPADLAARTTAFDRPGSALDASQHTE